MRGCSRISLSSGDLIEIINSQVSDIICCLSLNCLYMYINCVRKTAYVKCTYVNSTHTEFVNCITLYVHFDIAIGKLHVNFITHGLALSRPISHACKACLANHVRSLVASAN